MTRNICPLKIPEFFGHNMAMDCQELIHCEHVLNHFTVVCSVTWPLNGSQVGDDLALIKTSLFLLCKSSGSKAN